MENNEDYLPPAEELSLAEMDQLVKDSIDAWAKSDALKKPYLEAYHTAEELDAKIIKKLNAARKSKYFVDGIGTITVMKKDTVKVPSNNIQKKLFFKYLSDLGEDVFLSLATVNSNSLIAWYDKKIEELRSEGDALGFSVPGIEKGTTRETLRFTKDKGKSQ